MRKYYMYDKTEEITNEKIMEQFVSNFDYRNNIYTISFEQYQELKNNGVPVVYLAWDGMDNTFTDIVLERTYPGIRLEYFPEIIQGNIMSGGGRPFYVWDGNMKICFELRKLMTVIYDNYPWPQPEDDSIPYDQYY